jgi:hypothetical protein
MYRISYCMDLTGVMLGWVCKCVQVYMSEVDTGSTKNEKCKGDLS